MRRLLGIWLVLAMTGTSAAEPAEAPIAFRAQARVELDAHGVPYRVRADETLPAPIRDAIEKRVLQWRFEPARINGEPRPGATTVFLDACAVPAEQDGMNLAMEYRRHGPGYAGGGTTPMPPRYPVDAARSGKQGSFRLTLEVGVEGHVNVQAIETLEGTVWPFQSRLKEWASALRYVPEEIDGRPVATRIAMSVDFSIGDGISPRQATPERSPECTAAMESGTSGDSLRPVVLDSPFKPLETG